MGTPHDPDNLLVRVLKPAAEEAGCPWAGFHTFRHTVASRLIEQERNIVQVQRFLGHAKPQVTLDVYGHLLDGDVGGPLAPVATTLATNDHPQTPATPQKPDVAQAAF